MSEDFPDRWVRVMCDYSADAVWNRRGESCNAEDLSITLELVDRLRGWQTFYETSIDCADRGEVFDVEAFSALGLELAREVKRQLPDWTVIYFDEARAAPEAPRVQFEYEVFSEATTQGRMLS